MYFEDFGKIIFLFLILNTFALLASPFIFANYDIVISPKPVEVLEQQDLLARINSLETDNENLQTELETYPPKPINYTSSITFITIIVALVGVLGLLYWRDLKEKELKILQETKGGKKKWLNGL